MDEDRYSRAYGALRDRPLREVPSPWGGGLILRAKDRPDTAVSRNNLVLGEHPIVVPTNYHPETDGVQKRAENAELVVWARQAGIPLYMARILMPFRLRPLVVLLESGTPEEKRKAGQMLGKDPDEAPKPTKNMDEVQPFSLPAALIASAEAGLNYLWAIPSALVLGAVAVGRRGLIAGMRAMQAVEKGMYAMVAPAPARLTPAQTLV